MQTTIDIPTLQTLASTQAARGREGTMPALKGEGRGAGFAEEIAELICAADIACINDEAASQMLYDNAADYW